jgi:hypothetical protein
MEDEFATEKQQLKDDLAAEHAENSKASTAALQEQCAAEQADFK